MDEFISIIIEHYKQSSEPSAKKQKKCSELVFMLIKVSLTNNLKILFLALKIILLALKSRQTFSENTRQYLQLLFIKMKKYPFMTTFILSSIKH